MLSAIIVVIMAVFLLVKVVYWIAPFCSRSLHLSSAAPLTLPDHSSSARRRRFLVYCGHLFTRSTSHYHAGGTHLSVSCAT